MKILKLTPQYIIIQGEKNKTFTLKDDDGNAVKSVIFQTSSVVKEPTTKFNQKYARFRQVLFVEKKNTPSIVLINGVLEYYLYDVMELPKKIKKDDLIYHPEIWVTQDTDLHVFESYVKGKYMTEKETIEFLYTKNNLNIMLPDNVFDMSPKQILKYLEEWLTIDGGKDVGFVKQYNDMTVIRDMGDV